MYSYRIVSIDQQRIGFKDITLNETFEHPITVITSPSNALFPFKHANHTVNTNEIRFLLFSMKEVKSIDIYIDNKKIQFKNDNNNNNNPLHIIQYDYSKDIDESINNHTISIITCNIDNKCNNDTQLFTLKYDNNIYFPQDSISLKFTTLIGIPNKLRNTFLKVYFVVLLITYIIPNIMYTVLLRKGEIKKDMEFDKIDLILYHISFIKVFHLPLFLSNIPIISSLFYYYFYRTILFNVSPRYRLFRFIVILFQPVFPFTILNYGKKIFSISFPIFGQFYPFKFSYFVQDLDTNISNSLNYINIYIPGIIYIIFFSRMYHLEYMYKKNIFFLVSRILAPLILYNAYKELIHQRHFILNGILPFFTSGISLSQLILWYLVVKDLILNLLY